MIGRLKGSSEIVAELLKAKESDRMSDVYVKDLRGRLDQFAKAFEAPIGSLTTAKIEDFLRQLGLSGRSRNNYRRAIATLVYFAETRGYLANGTLVNGVPWLRRKRKPG